MRKRHLSGLVLLLPLAACGLTEDNEGKLASWTQGLEKAKGCFTVHAAAIGAGIGPTSVIEVTPDTADMLQGMRDTADTLPLDEAGQPTLRDASLRIVERLDKVKGQSPETIAAMIESEPYQRDVNVLADWYKAHCPADK